MARTGRLWCWVALAVITLWLSPAQAQTIEDVTVQTQGADVVAKVVFNATVRFAVQTPSAAQASDLYRITFDLVAADDAVTNQLANESKRMSAAGAVPEFTLSYEPTPGRRNRQMTLQLRGKAKVRVRQGASAKAIDIVFLGLASGSTAVPASPASPPAAEPAAEPAVAVPVVSQRYTVRLQRVPVTQMDQIIPVPRQFERHEVATSNPVVDGVKMFEVNLGNFTSPEAAEAIRQSALATVPQATVVALNPPSVPVDATPAASPAGVVIPAAAVASPEVLGEIDTRAAELNQAAREALTAKRNDDAIDSLNKLLLLPPNKFSKDAQELIGVAWERAGDVKRASVEYALYLKLYPDSEGADRVAQRLASIDSASSPPVAEVQKPGTAPATKSAATGLKYNGSVAQYYYGGHARSQSLVNITSTIDQATLSTTTESAIVTSLDLGARYITDESETRLVLRGTGSTNLQSTSHTASLLNGAYLDYKRTDSGLALRIGRQSPVSGGLLGFFDGVSMAYPFSPGWKLDVMGGVPANTLVSAPSQRLLAAMVEGDGIADHWGGNVYVTDQATQGISDRRAVGAEVRYSDEVFSAYSLLDYDTLFRKLNAITLQGSFQAPGQTTVTALVDNRNAPSLQLSNALISTDTGATSLKTLLQLQTLDQIRADALRTTAKAHQAMVSVSRPVGEKWQLSGDLRYSMVGELPAVGNFEKTPATGSQVGVSMQITGSNLYSSRDINNFNVSLLTSPLVKGVQLAYNNLTGLQNNDVTVEPSLRFYTQHDNQGVSLFRVTPGLRGTYRLSRRASVLGEGILEHSKTNGSSNLDTTNSMFFYVGYRYDLF